MFWGHTESKAMKIIENLPVLAHDKANHFVYGAFIASIGIVLFGTLIGMALCVILAVLKEVYDHWHPNHQADLFDAVWTVLGGLVVMFPLVANLSFK